MSTWGWKDVSKRALEFPAGDDTAVSPDGRARIRFNALLGRFEQSIDGADYVPLAAEGNVLEQDFWFVNSVTGDDNNDGSTPTSALKTLDALDQRLGDSKAEKPTLITLEGDFSSEILTLRVDSDPTTPVGVAGTATTVATGTITATSGQTVGDVTPPQITDPSVADWTPFIGKRLRIVSAPSDPSAVGKILWIARDEGANTASTSWAQNSVPALSVNIPNIDLNGLPTPPYSYVIEDLTPVGAVAHVPSGLTRVNLVDLDISGLVGLIGSASCEASGSFLGKLFLLSGCNHASQITTNGFPAFVGCQMDSPQLFNEGAFLASCHIEGGPISGDARTMYLAADTLSVGNTLYAGNLPVTASSVILFLGGASAYDSPGNGVTMEPGTFMRATGGLLSGSLYGTGNAVGLEVKTDASFVYDTFKSTVPGITGATEVIVGTISTTWAAIDGAGGLVDAATLARTLKG